MYLVWFSRHNFSLFLYKYRKKLKRTNCQEPPAGIEPASHGSKPCAFILYTMEANNYFFVNIAKMPYNRQAGKNIIFITNINNLFENSFRVKYAAKRDHIMSNIM